MFEIIKIVYKENKASKKWKDFVIYSLLWMIISAIAAYPDLLNLETDFLFTKDNNDFVQKLMLPFGLFLIGFTLDFFMSTSGLDMNKRRGRLYQCLFFLFVFILLLFLVFLAFQNKWLKYVSFALIWITISCIKGSTILLSWNGRIVQAKKPKKNIIKV